MISILKNPLRDFYLPLYNLGLQESSHVCYVGSMYKRQGVGATFLLGDILVFLWLLFLIFTQLKLFPCYTFVFDSDQGYYPDVCQLRDEDGHWIFQNDTSGFSGQPNLWTWIVGLPMVLILPYAAGFLLIKGWHRFKKSPSGVLHPQSKSNVVDNHMQNQSSENDRNPHLPS